MVRTLTDEQKQVAAAIHQFVEKEVRPAVSALDHSDRFPEELVARMAGTTSRRHVLVPMKTHPTLGAGKLPHESKG